MTRKYSSISVQTTLATGVSSSATTMTVATGTGTSLIRESLAAGNVDQLTLAIDPDTINEEIVFATGLSSDTVTIVRGRSGTSPIEHTGGATVKHVLTSDDLNYFTAGVDAAVTLTGTQTLTNKTLTAPVITTPKTTLGFNAQTGTTYTLVLTDKDKIVTLNNASAVTLTIPSGIFAAGDFINIQQIGVGQVTVANNGTSSFTGTGTKLRARYSAATIICTGTNTFTLVGDLS
jgi:hypothetical protein